MSYKTFFFNYFKTDIQSKTLLTKNVFSKSLIRKRYKLNSALASLKVVGLIDTDNTLFLKALSLNKVGSYAFLKIKKFSHTKLKTLKFKSFFFSENYLTKITALSAFLSCLKPLFLFKIPQLTTIICPLKGGYTVFSRGIIGFLPKRHYKNYFFKKIKIFRFTFEKTSINSLLKPLQFKSTSYFLLLFSVNKMLCSIKKAAFYSFLKKQKPLTNLKSNKYFKYKPAKTCFSFKFIFVSPFAKRSRRRNKKKSLKLKRRLHDKQSKRVFFK